MFVKIDDGIWVNMFLVSVVVMERDTMQIEMRDGTQFMVAEHYEPDVKKAMKRMEMVMMRFATGSFTN